MILRETVKQYVQQYTDRCLETNPTVRDYLKRSIDMEKLITDLHLQCNQVDFAFVRRGIPLSKAQLHRFIEDQIAGLYTKILDKKLSESNTPASS
jgi:hypothetical protein